MDEGVQTLLYVYACAQCEGTTHDNAYLATVHLVEDFQLLLNTHAALHHHDLLGGYSLLYQFPADVLIQIEATLLVLVVVGKEGNGSVV